MRRSLAVLASIGLGIGSIALASPAQATTESVEITEGFNPNILIVTPSSIAATVIEFTAVTGNGVLLTSEFLLDDGAPCDGQGCLIDEALTLAVAQGANNAVVTVADFGSLLDSVEFTVTYNGPGGGGDSGSAPASEIQQFGLPASGNCENGVTDAMNWSGVGLDGWGISWAQWANDGAGGAVCTRTVMYDTSTAKWVVN